MHPEIARLIGNLILIASAVWAIYAFTHKKK